MTAPNVHVGDKVRVTFTHEGIVAEDTYGLHIPSSTLGGGRVYLDDRMHPTVEVLERVVPKVGDVVKGTELDRLPDGSMVCYPPDPRLFRVKVRDGWLHFSGGRHGTVGPLDSVVGYRVLYVPEDGAE